MDTVVTDLTEAWTDLSALWAAADPPLAEREIVTVQAPDYGSPFAVLLAQGHAAPAAGHLLCGGDRLELATSPARRYWARAYQSDTAIVATGAGVRSVATRPSARPDFGSHSVTDKSYPHGSAIADLVLPAATGGSGNLSYYLYPAIAGLTFAGGTRTLSGTPEAGAAGAHAMLYVARDEAGADDALSFTITIT